MVDVAHTLQPLQLHECVRVFGPHPLIHSRRLGGAGGQATLEDGRLLGSNLLYDRLVRTELLRVLSELCLDVHDLCKDVFLKICILFYFIVHISYRLALNRLAGLRLQQGGWGSTAASGLVRMGSCSDSSLLFFGSIISFSSVSTIVMTPPLLLASPASSSSSPSSRLSSNPASLTAQRPPGTLPKTSTSRD